MASGPYFDPRRGTWSVQYFDGEWHRVTVVRKPQGYKPDPSGKIPRIPPEALAALAKYQQIETAARQRTRQAAQGTLRAFLGDHLAVYTGRTRDATSEAVAAFLAFADKRKIGKPDEVTTDIAQAWIDAIVRERDLTAQTARNLIGRLAPAWRRAVKRGSLLVNPWPAVEPRGRPSRTSRGSWTPEQFERLRRAAKPWLRDILTLGTCTGIRITALTSLEWGDVEFTPKDPKSYGWVKVRPELDKAGKGYSVPIGERLKETLKHLTKHRDPACPYVVTGQQGRKAGRHTVGVAIERACARAGLPRPDAPSHYMRRSFGRWAVAGHLTGTPVPVYIVQRWLGHSNIKMTMTYLDLHEDDSTRFMLGGS